MLHLMPALLRAVGRQEPYIDQQLSRILWQEPTSLREHGSFFRRGVRKTVTSGQAHMHMHGADEAVSTWKIVLMFQYSTEHSDRRWQRSISAWSCYQTPDSMKRRLHLLLFSHGPISLNYLPDHHVFLGLRQEGEALRAQNYAK
jgi:hypothetical protein